MYNKVFKNNNSTNNMNKGINHTIRNKNFSDGRIAELKWIEILKNKYKSILDNNIKNKYSHMDAISKDNGEIIEHEHKNRTTYRHNQFRGLLLNKCKIDYSIEQLKKGIRQIYYWNCKDGLYYWELKDLEKQADEIIYYRNGNLKTNEGYRDVVDIKSIFLKKYEE